jgi:hypothetical protein
MFKSLGLFTSLVFIGCANNSSSSVPSAGEKKKEDPIVVQVTLADRLQNKTFEYISYDGTCQSAIVATVYEGGEVFFKDYGPCLVFYKSIVHLKCVGVNDCAGTIQGYSDKIKMKFLDSKTLLFTRSSNCCELETLRYVLRKP